MTKKVLKIKQNNGFTFVEIMIVMAVAALFLIAAVPKARKVWLDGQINAFETVLDEIRGGMVDCRARFNSYTQCTWTMLTDEGFISPKTAAGATTGNPWGGSYGVTPSGQSFQVTAGGVQAEACRRVATKYSQLGAGVTGVCAGTNVTLTFAN